MHGSLIPQPPLTPSRVVSVPLFTDLLASLLSSFFSYMVIAMRKALEVSLVINPSLEERPFSDHNPS